MKDMVAELNTKGLDNWTALHFASNNGSLKMVEELLKQQAIEVNPLSTLNRTPLHLAACHGHTDVSRKLIGAGTNKNA